MKSCYLLLILFASTKAEFPRIALVKQVVYQDLYCVSNRAPVADLIFSSFKRPGMVALFTKYDADFHIVEVEPDSECQIWYEKVAQCKASAEYYQSLRYQIPVTGKIAGHSLPQGAFAKNVNDIDWGQYDIVISLDIAVPARVTQQYPNTLWAYYVGEGCQPSYKASFDSIIQGYDVFLTQDCFKNRALKAHVIDFPYCLQYYGCFHELFSELDEGHKGIYLETHTTMALTPNEVAQLSALCPVKKEGGSKPIKDMIKEYAGAKYFVHCVEPGRNIRMGTRGNACIQAIASGALAIVHRRNIINRDILTERTLVDSFEQVCERIKYFEENPPAYEAEVAQQRALVNELCCERPMKLLVQRLYEKRGG